MAGLLAWAADVVGGGGNSNNEDEEGSSIPIIFTQEQRKYVDELDRKAASLTRTIQDLRLRLPPPDISQRLPHLHAHSLASNAALALQLNSHSATRQQAQLRELTLKEENNAYEKAISDYEKKIIDKKLEADLLLSKFEEMLAIERKLEFDLTNSESVLENTLPIKSAESVKEENIETGEDGEPSNSPLLAKLTNKKTELSSMEERVKDLEQQWSKLQDDALRRPSPVHREKILDKQLHSLIEQLALKQEQAERLIVDIHNKEMELERLNKTLKMFESSYSDTKAARNRYRRTTSSDKASSSLDYIVDPHHKLPYYASGRTETQQRLILFRSAFVLYILALHVLVFIKISF